MPLSKDLREFIECLNSNKVEYLVVGALAVSWHGFPRYSGDVDFLIRPNGDNAEAVLNALRQFGLGMLDISAADLATPGKVVQLGYEPNRIDLITSITGVISTRRGRIDHRASWMGFPSTTLAAPRFCAMKKLPDGRKI